MYCRATNSCTPARLQWFPSIPGQPSGWELLHFCLQNLPYGMYFDAASTPASQNTLEPLTGDTVDATHCATMKCVGSMSSGRSLWLDLKRHRMACGQAELSNRLERRKMHTLPLLESALISRRAGLVIPLIRVCF
jgi:hypothetical protein